MAIVVAIVVSVVSAAVLYLLARQSKRLRFLREIVIAACTIFGALSGIVFYLWDHPMADSPSPVPQPPIVGTATTLGDKSPIVIGSGTSHQVVSGGIASPAIGGNVGSMSINVGESAIPKKEGGKK